MNKWVLWGACRVVYCAHIFIVFNANWNMKRCYDLFALRSSMISSRGPFGECVTFKWLVYCFIYDAKKYYHYLWFLYLLKWLLRASICIPPMNFIHMVGSSFARKCPVHNCVRRLSASVCAGLFFVDITLTSSINWNRIERAHCMLSIVMLLHSNTNKVNKRRK